MKKSTFIQFLFFLLAIISPFGGVSAYIDIAYAPLAFFFGIHLFRKSSPSYLSFCMWLWILTPLIRRLVDYHTTYHAQSLIMLAPFLVSSISCVSLRKISVRSLSPSMLSYLGIMIVVCWGFVVGIFESGIFAASYAVLTWLSPIFLAIHILTHTEYAQAHAERIFKTFSIATLIIGAYGLCQFFIYPDWDTYWVTNVNLGGIGIAEALSIRIFSTMNAPAVFALYVAVGILVTYQRRDKTTALICAVGIAGLMLSLVRSAWLFFLMALVFMFIVMKWKKRLRYMAAAVILAIVSLPLLTLGPIADQIEKRLNTFNNVSNDTSFQARSELYSRFTEKALASVVGNGLGQTGTSSRLTDNSELASLDSGVLDLLYTFGLFSLIVLFCILVISYQAFKSSRGSLYGQASSAITLAMTFQLIFFNILYAPTGILFFLFSALAIVCRSSKNAPTAIPIERRFQGAM